MISGFFHAVRARVFVRSALSVMLGLALVGCAGTRDPSGDPMADSVNDPFEPVNRVIFKANDVVDTAVIRPVAVAYRDYVPEGVQTGIGNFLRNLRSPIIIANELLQGDWQGAEVATSRFFINTTLGLGGFIDIAAYQKLKFQPEDFGQTLAVWGVGEGPYIVLPLLGPSSPRDALGLATDTIADPVRITTADGYTYARAGASAVDTRAATVETTDEIKQSSVDYYAAARSLYRQYRAQQIRDGADAVEAAPEIPDFSSEVSDNGTVLLVPPAEAAGPAAAESGTRQ